MALQAQASRKACLPPWCLPPGAHASSRSSARTLASTALCACFCTRTPTSSEPFPRSAALTGIPTRASPSAPPAAASTAWNAASNSRAIGTPEAKILPFRTPNLRDESG